MRKAILYEIVNKVNGKRYIGVTISKLGVRWGRHLYILRRGKATEKIQKDFNEYGEINFYIHEICNGKRDEMLLMEKELTIESVINGYNTVIGGGDSEERRSSSLVFKNKLRNNPELAKEFYRKIGDKNKGKKASSESRLKMSIKRKGVKWEQYKKDYRSKQYSGSGNPNAGKYRIYLNTQTGIFYETPDLIDQLGIAYPTLVSYIRNKNKKVSNFLKV